MPSDLTELAERIEQAEGPSRELDAEVALALGLAGGNPIIAPGMDGWLVGSEQNPNPVKAPAYTASLDAAMTLVPEGWTRDVDATAPELGITVRLHKGPITVLADSLSEPCATCAAALRVRLNDTK